eukprot:scaffold2750_cov380-Prasinococcus_capsulatus_cf.AAC.7
MRDVASAALLPPPARALCPGPSLGTGERCAHGCRSCAQGRPEYMWPGTASPAEEYAPRAQDS